MTTLVLHHDDCIRHDAGPEIPEQPDRVRAALAGITGLDGVEILPAPIATTEQVERAHVAGWVDDLRRQEPAEGRASLDWDTFLGPGSVDAALRAAGAGCFAIDQVVAGNARNAFCAVRPPGHHAEAGAAMGFCLINNAAVAARHAQAEHGIGRVTIIDFDVHHGNGTQEIFADSETVQYISSHQSPLYPGTGMADETGNGNILNLPLAPGTGSTEFRHAWDSLGLPAMHAWQPELVILSAGFDAHRDDPLSHLELVEDDFAWITREIRRWAEGACEGRVVSTLEGGYDLEALTACCRVHVKGLLGTSE